MKKGTVKFFNEPKGFGRAYFDGTLDGTGDPGALFPQDPAAAARPFANWTWVAISHSYSAPAGCCARPPCAAGAREGQGVAAEAQAHGFGIDGHHRAEVQVVGQVAFVQINSHGL